MAMAGGLAVDTDEVREGFLCPVCLQDLGNIAILQSHYEDSHSNEDKAVLHSIKDLIDKAKRKLLKSDDNESALTSDELGSFSSSGVVSWSEPQEIGATKSHTSFFKAIRGNRNDYYVLETNKLLIRLDKLVTDAPTDPVKRKAHERSIVMWYSDNDVPLCPGCARRFTITRRKHHCRLCGGVMCAQCSHFITHTYARKLTSPSQPCVSIKKDSLGSFGHSPSSSLSRSGSSSSLNSIVNSAGEAHIRLCVQCRKLLNRRDEIVEQHSSKPVVVHFHERLTSCIAECEELIPLYLKMADSLLLGETNYSLHDAQDVRIKLIKLAESIDLLSKKILTLGTSEEMKPNSRTVQLQRGIYLSANTFLKDRMLGLPSLPSEQEVAEFQEQRKKEFQMKIAQEKMAALQMQNQMKQQGQDGSPRRRQQQRQSPRPRPTTIGGELRSSNPISVDDGWAAASASVTDVDDPLVQQMNIIRSYITQARQAYKFDEVQMLEANLKELQDEYWRQQDELIDQKSS